MLAIPSPDLLVNLFASAAQLLGLLVLCLGGGLWRHRTLPKNGSPPRQRWLLPAAVASAVGLAIALVLYHLHVVDAQQRRLRVNLLRSSQEAGKSVGDTSLKTLAFSDQAKHPNGVTSEQLDQLLTEPDRINLVDVRETEEVEMGLIRGAWARRYPDLFADRSGLVRAGQRTILLCESGNRSSELATEFAREGIEAAFLVGGYEKWVAEGRPIDGVQLEERDELRALPEFPNKHVLLETDDVQRMFAEDDLLFVDVRYPKDFEQGHLPGAINLPLRKLRLAEAIAAIAALPNRPIAVPCYDKRSSFYGLILGIRLARAGRDFRGRYTLPQEFALPPKESEWVARWRADHAERTWFGDITSGLSGMLAALAQRLDSLVLAIVLAALALRLLLLPWSARADRDNLRMRALAPSLKELRQRLADDPPRLRRAVMAVLRRERVRPGRNLLVTIVQLVAFTAMFAAVDRACADTAVGWAWLQLQSPDPWWLLPMLVAGAMTGIVLVQGVRSRAGAVAAAVFVLGIGALVGVCRAGSQLYLLVSIGAVLVQTIAVRAWLRPRRVSTAGGMVPLIAAAGRDDLGGKARRLGEMLAEGLPVPDGFALADGHSLTAADRRRLARMRSGTFAVRSSAQGEDGAEHSHAGEFRTLLDVRADGLDNAIAAVRRSYGTRRGGVVVQPLIPASHAGVLFTEDPAHAGRMLVELVEGLGEALVSGAAAPSEHRFSRVDLRPIGRPPEIDLQPLLALGRRLERQFGRPQDIEWAFADGRFWLLQSRDITVRAGDAEGPVAAREAERARLLAAFADAPANAIVAEASDFAALLPAPTPQSLALMQDIWAPGGSVDRACRRLGLRFGADEGSPPFVLSVFGRCLLDRRQAATRIGFGSAAAFRLGAASRALEHRLEEWLVTARRQARLHGAVATDRLELTELLQLFATTRTRFLTETYVEAEVVNLAAEAYVAEAHRRLTRQGLDPLPHLSGIQTVVQRAFAALHGPGDENHRRATFLDQFGHRAIHDFELAEPRYAEAAATVATLSAAAPGKTPAPVVEPPLPPGRLSAAAVRRARRFQELKEEAKHVAALELAWLRQLLLAIGARTGLGDDVFFLHPDRLPMLADARERPAAAQLAARRRRDLGWLVQVPIPDAIRPTDLVHLGEERALVPQPAGRLHGTRVAGDRVVTGRAVVLREPTDLATLSADDILITRCTDPAWLPAFRTVRGLVTELGGWLSHGAIQAREQNLPAIVGATGAMHRLRTGMTVRLERDGEIAIVAENERAGDAAA
ncbi:MAG: YidC/Oxa1 family membrane protein insertase [Planctomycetes bacterium]|nr:YidC/Oxa1 family membrane protein insertase [Planctomycetota bacterium]